MSPASFFTSRLARTIALVLIFGAALAIRLYDLTDLPLDFHPTRQLVSVLKARGLYYKTQPAGVSTWELETGIRMAKLKTDIEPVIFERVVAFTYGFIGEQVWVARIYASLFWLVGGIFLFLLARELVSFEGALVATTYYLIFPYAIIASRSFQPDPLMMMLTLAFWWTFSRWISRFVRGALSANNRVGQWGWAVIAGLVGGAAIFVKFLAVFFVIGGALGLALSRFRPRDLLREAQVWTMALLGALPALIYMFYGIFIRGDLASQFKGRFSFALLVSPYNYLAWETKADMVAGGIFIMLALLGLFLVKDKRLRTLLLSLWAAYVLFGMLSNYHIATHDYYSLPLIPIVGLSLAPLGDWFFALLKEAARQRWMKAAVYVILLYGMFAVLWGVRDQMKAVDYRPEAAMWAEIGAYFEPETRVLALTQDYGSRLQYWGWHTPASNWPYLGDTAFANIRNGVFTFDDLFARLSSKMKYFLVTDFAEFDRQSELKRRLFATYPVYAEGNGYLIFDLKNPIQQDADGS